MPQTLRKPAGREKGKSSVSRECLEFADEISGLKPDSLVSEIRHLLFSICGGDGIPYERSGNEQTQYPGRQKRAKTGADWNGIHRAELHPDDDFQRDSYLCIAVSGFLQIQHGWHADMDWS